MQHGLVKTMVQLENCNFIAFAETGWDKLHNGNTTVEGYKIFRRDRQGRKDVEDTLYVKKWVGLGRNAIPVMAS